MTSSTDFFQSVIAAGAIIAGFCGSFLVFRIQREADYYRNPSQGHLGQQLFSSSFLLIILSTLIAAISGLVIPLIGLASKGGNFISPKVVVAGVLASLVILAGYFLDELVHYRIVWRNWRKDLENWQREWPILLLTGGAAGVAIGLVFGFLP